MTDPRSVVWKSQSRNSEESMPLGGGGLGLNVWAEQGALLIYFQQSGNFDEHNGFPKQGRLRILPEGGLSADGFIQELDTQRGEIRLRAGTGEEEQSLLLWVNQFAPEFHIQWESAAPRHLEVRYESWRFEDRVSPAENRDSSIFGERHDIFAFWMYPHDLIRRKDRFFPDRTEDGRDCLVWYHRNNNSDLAFDKEMDQQGFAAVKADLHNPQRDLIFGGCLTAEGLTGREGEAAGEYLGKPFRALRLATDSPRRASRITGTCQAGSYKELTSWKADLDERIGSLGDAAIRRSRQETLGWWEDFWNRSRIEISPATGDPIRDDEARQVSRNYRLFRFMLGFNHGGLFPTKFNGGLVTYDAGLVRNIEADRQISFLRKEAEQDDREFVNQATDQVSVERDFGPDYRAWGGGSITPQNQRLLYWPLLKSGDVSLMDCQFDWYRDALPAAEARVRLAWGHQGCSFAEQVNNFGIPIGSHFGWERPDGMGPGDQVSAPVHYHYSTQLEFAWMILQYRLYTGRDISRWMPFVLSAVDFFFAHYEHIARQEGREAYDDQGKLRITPSTGLESYKNAVNPQDVVCPLRRICAYLKESELVSEERRRQFRRRCDLIPEVRIREIDGIRVLGPADSWEDIRNVELPQLYPVYPYEFYGVGKKDLQLARDTWTSGSDEILGQKSYASWHQDGIFCAHLGFVEEAVEILVKKMGDSGRRFPAFWGPGHDWVPDHNWGGTGMIQLQDMLLQTDGDRILLFPCWPQDWDVRFTLHAPGETVVSCRLERGEVTELEVEPASRKGDVEILLHGAIEGLREKD